MILQVCEPLFSANKESKKKKNVNQGGTSSAKTYTILQLLFLIGIEEPGSIITVVGQDVPNLKKGAIRDCSRIVESSPYLQSKLRDYKNTKGYNKTDRIYEFKNGSIIEFNSYDNEQDAKSGKRDYLFVNEANGIPYEIYFQLSIRTSKKEFIDYNPTSRFWVHERLIGRDDCALFISDHRHNRFLLQSQHDEIEGIEDPELWKVYARGMTGQIHGLIYPKYTIIDEIPYHFERAYGLDFGFNHKTVLMEIGHEKAKGKEKGKLAWNELIYQSEITIGDLIEMMKEFNIGKKPIYADHAAPDKIEDLKRVGYNIHKADKDIKNGIDFVKRNGLYVTKNSTGTVSELRSYKFKVKDGITLEEPVKFKDDAMDAGRYGSYTGFRKNKGIYVSDNMTEDLGYDDSMLEAV